MDFGTIVLTLVPATLLVALAGWIGDWTGSRSRKEDDRFWHNNAVCCPGCNRPYCEADIARRSYIMWEHKHAGAVFSCSSCKVASEFLRGDSSFSYVGPSPQFRRCRICNNQFNGIPSDRCPMCGSDDSLLDFDSPFARGRPFETIG